MATALKITIIIFAISIFIFPHLLLAQRADTSRTISDAEKLEKIKGWGIKYGINYSDFRTVESDAKLGSTFGIFKEFKLSNKLAIVCEFQRISKKGAMYDMVLRGENLDGYYIIITKYNIYYHLVYIEMPILIKYYHPIHKNLNVYILTGPIFSLGFEDKSKKEIIQNICHGRDDPNNCEGIAYDYKKYYRDDGPLDKLTDSSGIGYTIGFGTKWKSFLTECRYTIDFYDMEVISIVVLNKKMHAVHLTVGYMF